MSTTYRDTFITLPVVAEDSDELTLSAHKVQTIKGNAKQTTLTYKDGETTERAIIALPVAEVRRVVLAAMTDWA